MELSESGVETAQYRAEVLRLTGKGGLAETLNHLRDQ